MFIEQKDPRSMNERYAYHPRYRGQVNFILRECEAHHIKAFLCNQELCIRSKMKIDAFEKIILSSFERRCDNRELPACSFIYRKGRSIIAVWNSSLQVLHLPEEKIETLKYYEYLGKIPFFPCIHLHNTLHEMREYLEEEEKVLI